MCLAVPGRVTTVYDENGTTMAEVDFGGVSRTVCLAFLPETTVGEYVIVHVGFAIQRLDEASARETLEAFEKLGILAEEFGDETGDGLGDGLGDTSSGGLEVAACGEGVHP